jgi:hypothetical protein
MPPPGGILSKPLRRSTRNAITIQQKCQPSKRHHHHDAHRRIKLNAVTASGAQCYPRLACALNGSNLMQVHYYARSAPALGLHPKINFLFCMQNHASLDASAYIYYLKAKSMCRGGIESYTLAGLSGGENA